MCVLDREGCRMSANGCLDGRASDQFLLHTSDCLVSVNHFCHLLLSLFLFFFLFSIDATQV